MMCKSSLETAAYAEFCIRYKMRAFGSKRFGQAFYDEFKLGNGRGLSEQYNSIYYAKTTEEAKELIKTYFTFN